MMKKTSIIYLFLGILYAGYPMAQPSYQVDDPMMPGKSFLSSFYTYPGEQITLDIYLADAAGTATTGGVWIDFSGSTSLLSYVEAQVPIPPWDPYAEVCSLPEQGIVYVCTLSSGGVNPDVDGDIIVCRVTFECLGPGDATITMSTIPGFTTWLPSPPYNDSLIAPKILTVHQQSDWDDDGIPDNVDNCPFHYNPNQEDTFPPGGNGIGNACDCEGNFDCDRDVDSADVATFLQHFGRNPYNRPCTNVDPCKGDFSCDGDVDAMDVKKFREDFGRNQYKNPCPVCEVGDWCTGMTTSFVYLCTEADCPHLIWTLGEQTLSTPMDCNTHLFFDNITAGYYILSISGCGYLWETEVYINGHSDYLFVLCPEGTNLDCCPLGCNMSNGEYDGTFICDDCLRFLSFSEDKGNVTKTNVSNVHSHVLSKEDLSTENK